MKRIGFAVMAAVAVGMASNAVQAQSAQDRPDAKPGFYIRGSLGYSFSAQDEIDYSPLWGLGVGYRINENLRTDFTIDWRDRYLIESGPVDSKMDNKAFMLNAYYDLDQLPIVQLPGGFKPYVGAGIGLSYVQVNDQEIPGEGGEIAEFLGEDEANFSWQIMAGVAYQLNPSMIFDLGYRYADLGDVELESVAGDIDHDFTTHEIIATVRYTF